MVVNEIRRKFAVPGLRRLLRDVSRQCQTCRVIRPKTEVPRMGSLPEARAAVGVQAFAYCGLDYFGPIEVCIGRRKEKRWVALFTCLTTRAVHLEVAHSLDMNSTMMCLRTMCARRNACLRELRSDCGTNFKAAAKELAKLSELFPLAQWVFNPPGAPHMGGAWESMVKVVKRAFLAVVAGQSLTEEVLRCGLAEAELIVNRHPLTHVALDCQDEPALTPADFLYGSGQQRGMSDYMLVDDDGGVSLRRSWRRTQQIADHFWKRFAREVIPVLNMRTRWFERKAPIRVGEPVLVVDETRRGGWRRGVVIETFCRTGCDQVRTVRLKTASGEILRPVAKCARLDPRK